ncbi:MAG: PorT family protein [Prevotella sp.]|nr:PorT family protein [Prevotella sp.]
MRVCLARFVFLALLFLFSLSTKAQIGEYRNVFAVGVNGGYTLTSVGFSPKVTTKLFGGYTGGLSLRYTSEKYFTALCSLAAEINWAQAGWSENILTINSEPVVNQETGEAEFYDRRITYVQMPIMAHLAWGKEVKGFSFFFYAGPQFGLYLSESTRTNFTTETMNVADRANKTTAQYDMPVEKKFDYGICAGLGTEYSHPALGHFRLDVRYYLGLANIYGATKSDYFGKTNQSAITVKVAWLVDVTGRKSP